ncbi:glycosyltransferase [Paracrocinitomix mangrovi]|uniref:glycosyltransferase n=1 Tax=Paracrocinitomix mangrovi TaxID=2862509 RepID=UPI001C8E2679|nr:glycosyltransferase [Paracrocinitomix mangrovi]UKN01778.1 glycosyltransferase [Paracrocinitomix mangrovi]
MNIALSILGCFWVLVNLILLVFVVSELFLLLNVFFKKRAKQHAENPKDWPLVCIQLPIYNEKYVVNRLIDQVCLMDYPLDKLEIQILDDSTDDTSDIVTDYLKDERFKQFQIHHVRRGNREGYKAGALDHGMQLSKADYFAIFDADFLPDPQFLKSTVPYLLSKKVGVVQSRWCHINEDDSYITKAEAMMLDAHFGIEQQGRSEGGHFINFNGTAGIWKRSCIDDAGGWQGDTLTEDLDLSFRAQMRHWKVHYLFNLKSPSELPLTFSAYRNQQYRWSKGAAECVRKNLKALWKSPVTISTKVIGSLHLFNSSVYLLMILLLVMAPFVFFIKQDDYYNNWIVENSAYLGVIVNGILLTILFCGKLICGKTKFIQILDFIPTVFMFFSISMGISPHMVAGVLQGYRGKRSEFVRTPKFGDKLEIGKNTSKKYGQKSAFDLRIVEVILFCYGIFWMIVGIYSLNFFTILYSSILLTGFSIALFFPHKSFMNRSKKSFQNKSQSMTNEVFQKA